MTSKAQWQELGWTNEKPVLRRYMSRDVALMVRGWRVDVGMTWRSVAEEWSDTVTPQNMSDKAIFKSWSGHQMFGQEICEIAAEVLGEDANADPWN